MRFIYTIILAGLCLVAGCTKPPDPPLRVGTNVWPGYEPLYLARSLEYLPKTRVKLVEYSSASEVIRAFRHQSIEAATLTLDEVLLLVQDQLAPRVVLVMDISHGGDVILAKPELTEFAMLKGRRIGVERRAVGAYVLSRALAMHNMSTDMVQIVLLEADEHETAYLQGKVDAVVTFEPVRGKLLQAGAQVLFDSRRIPGEIVDVLVVRQSALETMPEQVRLLLAGWFKATDYMRRRPREAYTRMARRQGIDADAFARSLQGLQIPDYQENLRFLSGPGARLPATAHRLRQVMQAQGSLEREVDLSGLFSVAPLADLSP